MSEPVDWVALAYRLGTITDTEGGYSGHGGTEVATKAVVDLLGAEVILSAVDAVLAMDRGSEVARSVLRLLKPEVARQRCLEVINGPSRDAAHWEAGHLLSDLCDRDWQPFYEAMAQHSDSAIRGLSMKLLENAVFAGWVEVSEAIELLSTFLADPASGVAAMAQQMIGNMEEDLALEQASKAESETE